MRKMHMLSQTDTNTHRHTHVAKTDRGEGRCWLSEMYREEKIWNETDCQRSKKSRPKPIQKVLKNAVYYDKTQHVKNALSLNNLISRQPNQRPEWGQNRLTLGLQPCSDQGQGVAGQLTAGAAHSAAGQQHKDARILVLVPLHVHLLQRL